MGNQSSNAQQLNMMKQDIQSLFTQADQDHDGYLNQADFSSFIKSFVMLWGHNVPTEDKIKSLFTSNDSDNDGKLSRADIDNMLLPEGHENISYDPNNQQGPPSLANSALANPFAKLDAAFGPPITGPPGYGPGPNSNPYQGLGGFPNLNPNQQFGQFGQNPPPNAQANPLGFNFPFGGQQNLQGQNANANPFGFGGFPANQTNVNQNVQNNQSQNAPPGGQPLQNIMNQLVSGIGNAFQGLNLNTQQPGTSSTSQNQAPNASGLLSGLSNTMTDLLAMGASLSFNQADLDKDGFIGLDELETLMNEKSTMHGLPTYTNDQVQSQMDKYDQDGDGKLNLQEYQEMIKKGSNFFLNKPMHALMGGGPNQGGANVNPNQSVPEDVED